MIQVLDSELEAMQEELEPLAQKQEAGEDLTQAEYEYALHVFYGCFLKLQSKSASDARLLPLENAMLEMQQAIKAKFWH